MAWKKIAIERRLEREEGEGCVKQLWNSCSFLYQDQWKEDASGPSGAHAAGDCPQA